MKAMVMAASGGGNFLVPNATFIAELFAFLIILGVLAKWVVPYLNSSLTARQDAIRLQFTEAEDARHRLEAAEQKYREALAASRADAARVREEARAQAAAIAAEVREQAQAEANRILAQAQAQLEIERSRAVAALRADLGTLAVDLAERIVGESLRDTEVQERVVDRFLAELDGLETSTPETVATPPGKGR